MKSDHTHFDYLTGHGVDVHALQPTTDDHAIVLCGIAIPCRFQLIAHSDGDVALHALVDALLGTISAGDIGDHFPPTDARWKNADSSQFVKHALQLCHEKNAVIVNADITILCEKPKISPYKSVMKNHVAALLNIKPERVSIKATTTEKLGFLGKSEGVAAFATVSIKIPA